MTQDVLGTSGLSGTVARPALDYSLTGADTERARAAGLVNAQWYQTEVPRKVMKDLMQRRDGPALRDTAIWILLHVLFAWGGIDMPPSARKKGSRSPC